MNKIEGLVKFPKNNPNTKKSPSRTDINKARVRGIVPCNENNLIVDGNKINPDAGVSNNAKILYG